MRLVCKILKSISQPKEEEEEEEEEELVTKSLTEK
jgi:hypothetical protein